MILSEENNKAFGRRQSFVAGAPKEGVQFIVKDSTGYMPRPAAGGSLSSTIGKPIDEAMLKECFPCHEPAKGHDLLFTHYGTLRPQSQNSQVRRPR